MAKPLTSWLVPSFSQHNLRLVVLGRYLHVSVTKYQDKFARLQQVNSHNSWDKFQIRCTDMYLIRFLLNFAAPLLLEISKALYLWAASFTFYKLATKKLHLATIFLWLDAKRRPADFFNFEPWFIDENLRLQTNIDKLSKKITSGIGAITRIRDFVPTSTLHCIYNALIQSLFKYCNIVRGNCGKTLFDRLQKLQNRVARVLTFTRYDADAKRLFRQLKSEDLSTQFQIQNALMVTSL